MTVFSYLVLGLVLISVVNIKKRKITSLSLKALPHILTWSLLQFHFLSEQSPSGRRWRWFLGPIFLCCLRHHQLIIPRRITLVFFLVCSPIRLPITDDGDIKLDSVQFFKISLKIFLVTLKMKYVCLSSVTLCIAILLHLSIFLSIYTYIIININFKDISYLEKMLITAETKMLYLQFRRIFPSMI